MTLLLLHGFTGSPRSFDRWLAAMASDTPAVSVPAIHAPWLPGHGLDTWPDVHSSTHSDLWTDAMARVLEELPRRCLDGPLDVLGYSLGGRVALGLLAIIPERIGHVMLVGSHLGLRGERAREERRARDAVFVRLLRERGVDAFATLWESQTVFASQRRLSRMLREARAAERRGHAAEGLAQSLERMGLAEMPDLRGALARFPGRVTFVHGALDGPRRAIAREVSEVQPRAEIVEVPEVGHDPLLEAPRALASLLGPWMRATRPCAKPEGRWR